jgi:Zn-finger nucleic acid-binding protein
VLKDASKLQKEFLLNCPLCEEPMVVLELHQIEVDHCLSCKGIWLDAGELELLLQGAGNSARLLATIEKHPSTTEKKIRCPVCSKKMKKMLFGEADKICIDRCPGNEGIWFDKGELKGIIAMGDFTESQRIFNLLSEVFGDHS